MIHRLVRPLAFAALTATLAGCAMRPPEVAPPTDTASAWTYALAQASQDAQAGRHAAADRLLLDFQQTHPAAPEAADAAYYRALFKLDPSNPAMSTRDAVALLDGLIATPIVNTAVSPRHADAVVLRRVAMSLDTRPLTVVSAPAAASAPAASATPARAEDLKAKDDEIARLRDELAKANAELERIKRRVATPTP